MAFRCGSLSRSLIASTRASSFRSSSSLPRFRPPPVSAPRLPSRRPSFSPTRHFGELGCAQSLLPLHMMVAAGPLTSHLAVKTRACCELSHGTFCRTCQDR